MDSTIFGSALTDALDKDCSYDIVQSVHEQIRARIEEHKESKDPEPLELTAGDVGGILANRYVRTKFRMNSKEPETVELICANETMDAIIDQFGEEVKTYAYSLSSFRAEVEVTTSQMFFSWIFGLGGRVMINGPQRVKDEYEKMVRDAAANLSHQLCERLK